MFSIQRARLLVLYSMIAAFFRVWTSCYFSPGLLSGVDLCVSLDETYTLTVGFVLPTCDRTSVRAGASEHSTTTWSAWLLGCRLIDRLRESGNTMMICLLALPVPAIRPHATMFVVRHGTRYTIHHTYFRYSSRYHTGYTSTSILPSSEALWN